MILAHYSRVALDFDPARTYEQLRPTFKPSGLWLTVDGEDGWKEWCESEQFGLDRLAHRTVFLLRSEANVLRLTTPAEVAEFSTLYADPARRGWVGWSPVVARYDGVLITPYLWASRMALESVWYSTWDCASGCFWNLDAVEPVASAPTASKRWAVAL